MTINAKDELEISLYTLLERALMLAYPNGVVDSSTRQQMIADSVPGYPITSDQGIGVSIIRSDLVETPSQPIGTYPIYTPAPLADGSDPENLLSNFVQDTVGYIFPTQDRYVQTPVKHLTVSKGPVDQRWEMIIDSQTEYSALIRNKLEWTV
jgi:hypothetical protein